MPCIPPTCQKRKEKKNRPATPAWVVPGLSAPCKPGPIVEFASRRYYTCTTTTATTTAAVLGHMRQDKNPAEKTSL